MVTLYDVPAEELIEELAVELQDDLDAPNWAAFVKSGSGREFPPEQEAFWHRRAASILRTIAIDGPVGVNSLSTKYGSSKQGSNRYRVAPTHRNDASENIIRTIIQQLEAAGYVEESPGENGRVVSAEGQSFIDSVAGDVLESLDRPELERYA